MITALKYIFVSIARDSSIVMSTNHHLHQRYHNLWFCKHRMIDKFIDLLNFYFKITINKIDQLTIAQKFHIVRNVQVLNKISFPYL